MRSLWKQEKQISRELKNSVIIMITCRVNDPNRRSNIARDISAKGAGARTQRRVRNLVGELHEKVGKWTCENYNTIYFYPNSRLRKWLLEVTGKSIQRLLEVCLLGVITDSGCD